MSGRNRRGRDAMGVGLAAINRLAGAAVIDRLKLRKPIERAVFEGSKAYAEYVSVPANELARKPTAIDHVHAAAAPMSLLTAWQYLVDLGHDVPSPFTGQVHRPVPITPGTTVLVNGAAGGFSNSAVVPLRRMARNACTSRTSATAICAPASLRPDAWPALRVTTVTGSPRRSSARAVAEPTRPVPPMMMCMSFSFRVRRKGRF